MTDYIDKQGFRANVGIVLMRDGGELFLGGRRDGRGWQFPQGGVRRNELPEDALFRELHEEIGLVRGDVEVLASTAHWLRYRLPRQYVRHRASPLCIGQKQRWFLLRMIGDESRLRYDATAEPEFNAGRWVDYWSPVREVIYFKRAVYARALQELGERAFPLGPPPRPDWWSDEMLHTREAGVRGGERPQELTSGAEAPAVEAGSDAAPADTVPTARSS